MPEALQTGYVNLPTEIHQAISRGETFYIGIEFYLPTQDDIFSNPEQAIFRLSDSRFTWNELEYRDSVKNIPELKKFIGKTFNSFTVELMNVERNFHSGANIVFKRLIRGFRIAVRIIFPNLELKYSRLIWWGRIANVQDLNESDVKLICSQEIGDLSYELATKKYGQACPLWFGKGECLGTQTLEEKSPLFQLAFNIHGQGGCNRTEKRCDELGNRDFYQGQNSVTVTGKFTRIELVKKKILWIFSWTKKNKIPVQWSSKNQSENSDITIPNVYGRARVELQAFTWADIGTQIIALMGGSVGQIEGFYNITCHNENLTIQSVTQHLGELGRAGTQQPDPRFPQSGVNSRLAYCGITFSGSPPDDEPEEVPTTSAVIKGKLIKAPILRSYVTNPPANGGGGGIFFPPIGGGDDDDNPHDIPPILDFVQNAEGIFVLPPPVALEKQWNYNPVWVTRDLLVNFPFTVIKESWLNDHKNSQTADYCFTVVEDDTDAEIPVITSSAFTDHQNEAWQRFRSTSALANFVYYLLRGQNELSDEPDIWWNSPLLPPDIGQSRTYLALRYTANGVINDKAKLSDVLFSLVLPTFRGFLRFNHFGQIEIDCRKPADNTYIRAESVANLEEIPVVNVSKFINKAGFLLIGVGKETSEVAKILGIRYINGSALTTVSITTSQALDATVSPTFIARQGGASEIYIDFSGSAVAGERIHLKFTEPDNTILEWDYYVDAADDSLDLVIKMFQTRLMASPKFRETFTAEIFDGFPNRIVIRCQTGYIQLDRPLKHIHNMGEEVLRVVEVYEDAKDEVNIDGVADNMKNFVLNVRKQDTYHGVKAVYISAVQDFRETELLPRVAWDAAEQERNLKLLELDLRFVDNYRQSAFLAKSAAIEFIDGNLWSQWSTGIKGMFHEEGDVIAVRHQTMKGISYTPFTVEDIQYQHSDQSTGLVGKMYLSAAFDERVAKEEKFLETSLTPNSDPQLTPPASFSSGGYSSTGTGDGQDRGRGVGFEPQPYETFPQLQLYSPHGRDRL